MKSYGVNELRKMFLTFFEGKGHLVMPSFSLVPHNDNSLLLINAGMAPLKPYFTGEEIPPRRRVATCQKCIRTGDIENVGRTARHLTFFEMLGNFSFGDYFKEEAIAWSWEFLTETLGLDPARLYPSIYGEDEEAFRIWNEQIGIPAERIKRFYRDPDTGECDNFWEHGAGPCGPCSEIYYDRGEQYGCGRPDCGVGCDCDRYMEVWNNVFTQFSGDGNGQYEELENKNIDTGMGLERLAVVMQEADTVFDIDTMREIRDKVCALSGCTYRVDDTDDISIRVITDHIRSATFMVSDGIMPSNEGRGYVLRRIIRRAARHGRMLGIDGAFLAKVAQVVIDQSRDGYPELAEKQDFILKVLTQEEERFAKTLDAGLAILSDMEETMRAQGVRELAGEDAFKLYDTYGFPVDLTAEILSESGYTYDQEGFAAAMEAQRAAARAARKETDYSGHAATIYDEIDPSVTTEFTGYDRLTDEGRVAVLVKLPTETEEAALTEVLTDGDAGTIVTDVTPFYATRGGQVGDAGVITAPGGTFAVSETIALSGGRVGHVGRVTSGMIRTDERVTLAVDASRRAATCRNHSATHLMQEALREVLGTHVEQAGSYQDAQRTRFDFSHFQAMTPEEVDAVERLVNEKIAEGLSVTTEIMGIEEARKSGAMALFGEKYGDTVRVVSMGDFSKELCGGTHVHNTADISAFKILSESGVAAGVRRVEALTGANVLDYYRGVESCLDEAARAAKTEPEHLAERIAHMQEQIKTLTSENESLKSKAAQSALGDVMDEAVDVDGVKLLAVSVPDVDMNGLRDLGDQLKGRLGEGVLLLASASGGKVNLVAMATEEAMARGAHAGNLIKAAASQVGGGGGGRPNMAQAGGKDPAGIPNALAAAREALSEQIKKP